MDQAATDKLYVTTYFARQPILDADQNVWAYRLLYREVEGCGGEPCDADQQALDLLCESLLHQGRGASGAVQRVAIPFPAEAVSGVASLSLPTGSIVPVIDAEDTGDDLLDDLRALKAEGYALALSGYTGQPAAEALLPFMDVVFVPVGRDEARTEEALRRILANDATPAAMDVDTRERFNTAKALGFSLFLGRFFQRPEVVSGRRLSTNIVTKLQLSRMMLDEDTDFSELAATIQADVSVSYRLLTLINSAAFGYKDIDSIERAVVLLGWEKLKNWVYLVVLTDIQPKGKSSELPYLSTIRAKFLESAAQSHGVADPKPQSLFLLGLFSLLDAMLDQTMDEVVAQLPLDDAISQALAGADNELAPWLALARCFETGDWNRLDELVERLGLDATRTAGAYFEAIGWTKSFFQYD
mgnify:CR=1 FL=1